MRDGICRRDFLKLAGVSAAGCAMFGCAESEQIHSEEPVVVSQQVVNKSATRKLNIIFILADDLGYGDLSCYGQKKFRTPNLDRMAAEGMRFTQHYSGSTVCAPSRCALMTGLHTGHCQIRGNQEVKPEGQMPMKSGTVAVPTLLKQTGYVCGMFGKWGLGAPSSTSDPMEFFDEFYGYNCQRQAHTYYPGHLWHNRSKVNLDGETYSHDLIMDAAKKFIRANKDRPFFCYMPVTIPHAAMHAPKDLHDKYRKVFPEFEGKVGKYSGPKVNNPIAAFAAMVEHLDNGIREVMDLLKETGIDDNTIVMFSSDNGAHKEGGAEPEFFNSSGPLRGIKRDLYEGGIRVPMIARWPGKIKAGAVSEHISAFWDFLPTCCELAEVKTPKGIDGISFVPTLLGHKQKQHEYMYWEFYEQKGKQAVRWGDWKGVRLNVKKNPDGPIELYNLKDDLGEKNNIADEHPDIVKTIAEIMKEVRTDSEIFKF